MRREGAKPIVIVQAAKDWMLNAVIPEIGVTTGFEEGNRVQSLFGQTGQHYFPVIQQQCIERNRCFDTPSSPRDQCHGDMNALQNRHSDGRLARDFRSRPRHQCFDHRDVGDNFGGGPGSLAGRRPPVLFGDLANGGFEFRSGATKFFQQRPKVWHWRLTTPLRRPVRTHERFAARDLRHRPRRRFAVRRASLPWFCHRGPRFRARPRGIR